MSADTQPSTMRRRQQQQQQQQQQQSPDPTEHSTTTTTTAAAKTDRAPAAESATAPGTLQLVVCALGIYACYLRYGLLQEGIYSARHGPNAERYSFSLFLVFVQTSTNAAVALLVILATRLSSLSSSSSSSSPSSPSASKQGATTSTTPAAADESAAAPASIGVVRGVPLFDYMVVALSYLSAMVFSFTALNHMTYPMQALGKSCKMIPVMLMGIVIRGRRYTAREFFCVALITAGVALFSYKPSSSSSASAPASPLGFALLFASLFMDGVTGPLQERVVARFSPSTHQLMFWQNLCAAVWLAGALVVSGEGAAAVAFLARFPAAVTDIMLFSLVSALGQNFIFYTVRNFSALVVTTITTTRKMFTVLLSIFVYNHSMVPRQWAGLFLVFAAITWEAAAKQRAKTAKAAAGSKSAATPAEAKKAQ